MYECCCYSNIKMIIVALKMTSVYPSEFEKPNSENIILVYVQFVKDVLMFACSLKVIKTGEWPPVPSLNTA